MKRRSTLYLTAIFLLLLGYTSAQKGKTHFDNKPYVEGEFLVQLTAEDEIKRLISSAPAEYKVELVEFLSPPMLIWLIKFDHHVISHEAFQYWLYTQKNVTVADYNYHIQMRSTVPNDASFGQQWHHVNTGQNGGTPDADIDSDLAWDITTGGTTTTNDDIVVCMVESSGGNLNHQDLNPNRWINTAEIPGNGIDDDGNGYIDDYYGWNTGNNNDDTGTGSHGTNCLGMIGAKGNNGLNVVGANWDVKLMVINMPGGQPTQASVITAYTYPLVMRKRWNASNGTEGAFVVATSGSWGIDGANASNYPLWCAFYDTLGYHGILNIGATTNSNLNVDTAGDMPTTCSSNYMIGVGRTDRNDNTAGGYGVNSIPLGAPGIDVVTTNGTSGITTTTGTSFSCPLTAGVVGLAYSIPCPSFMSIVKSNPRMGADLVREALLGGVDVKSQLATRFSTSGRLNSRNTLDLLMAETCSPCFSQNISVSTTGNDATITFDANTEVNSVNLHWRAAGTSTWTVVNGISSPYQLDGLETCSAYEFYLENICTGETGESSITNFATVECGNCVDLTYCTTRATGATQARLAFLSPSGIVNTITNYTLTANWGGSLTTGYAYGNLVLMNGTGTPNEGCGTISNAAALNGNIAVALRGTCDFSAKAFNAQNAGATALILINNQGTAPASLGAGANSTSITIPVVMISQSQGATLLSTLSGGGTATGLLGVQNEWIESFTLNGVTTTSGNNNGYADANATNAISMELGESYSFNMVPGFGAQALPEYTRIWLDENQNGTFETSELIFNQGSTSFGATTGSITIPLTAALGSTRLRVQMAYQGTGQTTLPGVCGNFTWGEVEDYCVTITESNVGLTKISAEDLKVYPNPTQGLVHFNWKKKQGKATLSITDLVGKELYTLPFNSDITTVDISTVSAGTYLYKITGEPGNVLFTGKVVVER